MKNFIIEIKKFFNLLLTNNSGLSSKRAIGLLGMCSLIFLLFWNIIRCSEGMSTLALIDAVLYTTIGALFGTSIEKIWPNKKI